MTLCKHGGVLISQQGKSAKHWDSFLGHCNLKRNNRQFDMTVTVDDEVMIDDCGRASNSNNDANIGENQEDSLLSAEPMLDKSEELHDITQPLQKPVSARGQKRKQPSEITETTVNEEEEVNSIRRSERKRSRMAEQPLPSNKTSLNRKVEGLTKASVVLNDGRHGKFKRLK